MSKLRSPKKEKHMKKFIVFGLILAILIPSGCTGNRKMGIDFTIGWKMKNGEEVSVSFSPWIHILDKKTGEIKKTERLVDEKKPPEKVISKRCETHPQTKNFKCYIITPPGGKGKPRHFVKDPKTSSYIDRITFEKRIFKK